MDISLETLSRSFVKCSALLFSFWCVSPVAADSPPKPPGQSRHYLTLTWLKDLRAQIDLDGSKARMVLPLLLKQTIEKQFPGFRVPSDQDYKLDWSGSYDYPETHARVDTDYKISDDLLKSSRVPFLTIGDLNQDGKDDIAALIVSAVDDTRWKLVVFHLVNGVSYVPVVLDSSPEDCLSLPKGNCGPVQRYGLVIEDRCSDGRPCLTSFMYESSSTEFLWRGGTYVRVHTSD